MPLLGNYTAGEQESVLCITNIGSGTDDVQLVTTVLFEKCFSMTVS